MSAWVALAAGVFSLGGTGAESPPARPNVVILLADDLGFSDLGCYGGEIATPTIDRLADQGLRFTQFYNTARCWPSRAALLTGYYAQQVNRDPGRTRPRWARLLPELLAPAGYRSYHAGKWHVDGPVLAGGFQRSYLVVDQDRFFSPKHHALDDVPLPQPSLDEGYYATTAITDRAIEFLDQHDARHAGEPFLLYLAYTCPHFPLQAPGDDVARHLGRYASGWDELRRRRWERATSLGILAAALSDRPANVPEWASLSPADQKAWDARMAVHAAMVERMDREIARVLAWLDAKGKAQNTLVLFCSDNGASAERVLRGDGHDPAAPPGSAATFQCLEPPWAALANAPLRKSKIFTHEGGISTPLVLRWPGGIKARGELRRTPGHLIDVVPTLLELAGLSAADARIDPEQPALPGKSLVPALSADERIPRDYLFFHHEGNRALREGDWKIVASGSKADWELYDLAADRTERNDLARKEPDRVARMAAIWRRCEEEFRRQGAAAAPPSHQATGVKIGEVTPTSAILWTRRTLRPQWNTSGEEILGKATPSTPPDEKVPLLRYAAPGMPGRVRVRLWPDNDPRNVFATEWREATARRDFTVPFPLENLRPATEYRFAVDTAAMEGKGPPHVPLRGRFKTAPAPESDVPVRFVAMTCQAARDVDHPDGFRIYRSMLKPRPDFLVPNGDIVYLDSEAPRARSVALARYHWNRMYGFPRLIDFHRQVPGYWTKDDHDTYANDCWPGLDLPMMLPLTYADGHAVNREQLPWGEKPYRKVRWGKRLEVWLVEGRDFRSPNSMPDGAEKTIWGAEQKRWFKETIAASDADWKVLVSPTPLVGPDRASKRDNHANAGFAFEGKELRQFLRDQGTERVFVVCGDRHWQYHSVDPETGVHEFSSGPASDEHASGSPGRDQRYHRFHRVGGGYLSVEVHPGSGPGSIVFRHHDVAGKVVHEQRFPAVP